MNDFDAPFILFRKMLEELTVTCTSQRELIGHLILKVIIRHGNGILQG
jgi:hypothetical protein